ncbi:hypothetical protein CC80DRAFT_502733 [Byssothecium circinans]|uniref:Uncharacterized protein n=1 Tax=Byssothecium circinans TaxID=147558 RepID=A0A6A5U1J9_9PLEO|nr:hypothetical protein CC80DRAFT_502733 [Byssothecium circinans]
MPPLNHILQTLPSPHSLHRRGTSCASASFDTTCSLHRTILLSIIGAVVLLKILVLTALYARHRKRKAMKQRLGLSSSDAEKPALPEEKKKKFLERERWEDPALEIPPPVYSREYR